MKQQTSVKYACLHSGPVFVPPAKAGEQGAGNVGPVLETNSAQSKIDTMTLEDGFLAVKTKKATNVKSATFRVPLANISHMVFNETDSKE